MQFEHSGITVSYDEKKDNWTFQLRGRLRTAPTPAKAKEFIDKEPAPDKAKPFQRFKAYVLDSPYSTTGNVDIVEVTSMAESPSYITMTQEFWVRTTQEFWVRTKISCDRLLVISAANEDLLQEMRSIRAQVSQLNDAAKLLNTKLERIPVPKDSK